MNDHERNAVIRVLELLVKASETGFKKIPAGFRPPGIQENLDEAKDLLRRIKAKEFG